MPIVVEVGDAVIQGQGRWRVDVGQAVFKRKGEGQLPWWSDGTSFEQGPLGPWDRLQLGSILLPGVWEVTSGECARQVDHKKTKGKDGARIKDQGLLPARFTATGHVIHEDEWVELQLAIPDISPRRKGGLRTPFTIFHPAIALLGVTTVYVERIKAPEIKNGVLEIGIDMIEWTDQPKTARTGETPAAKVNGKGGSRAAQYLANSMATPVSQWYGHAVHVGPTPSDEQLAAWNRSGGSVEEYFRIQSTGRPSQSVVSEFENQRGTRAGGQ